MAQDTLLVDDPGGSTGSDWFTQNAPLPVVNTPQGQTLGSNDAFAVAIKSLYAQYGQPVSDAEIEAHRGNPGGVQAVASMLAQAHGQRGAGNGDAAGFGQAWIASGGTNINDLKAFVAAHPEYGATITGSKGDKVSIGGYTFDAVEAAGVGGGKRGIWNDVSNGGENLTAPYTEQFQAPSSAALPPAFEYQDFQAPTGITEQNDPGFQERLKQGQTALERSAAARGTLLTGGTLKGLMQFGQDFASNEYGNVYNRALQDWGTNYQKGLTNYSEKYGTANDEYNRAAGEYQTRYNVFTGNQNNAFNKLFQTSSLDSQNQNAANANNLGWASLYANTATGGANAQANNTLGAGNAAAAGQVGSANAWANLFPSIGNNALGLYYNYANQNRTATP